MTFNLTRLMLYSIISSLEEDLRELIVKNLDHLNNIEDVISQENYQKCIDRMKKDSSIYSEKPNLDQIINYLDFSDSVEILNRNKPDLPLDLKSFLKENSSKITNLYPIRNRVAHSRPLNYDDYTLTLEIVEELITKNNIFWPNLKETVSKLKKDPSFVFGLEIPSYDIDEDNKFHNLPLPDFDETGFIGRQKVVSDLLKQCLGPYPVITIVGEGGLGKTALALKVAYDLLDHPDNNFEAIVWTSSKTTNITANDIQRIESAITTSIGIFHNIAKELGVENDSEGSFLEILEYMKNFRILLILDNLETVIDERIRNFLEKLPIGSKILITSRIGMGAFEYPIKLAQFKEDESIQLLRSSAQIRNTPILVKMPNSKLAGYCKKMKNNPGFIKWFVSAVQTGRRPEEVFANSHIFLEFCLSNVHNYLSPNSKRLLRSMQCITGQLSQAELAFLNQIETIDLQRAIQQLLSTNMIIMTSIPTGSSFESRYELSELSREYLAKKHPIFKDELKIYQHRKNQLTSAEERLKVEKFSNPYSINSISIRSKSDVIVGRFLIEAFKETKIKNYNKALDHIENAKKLAPEYYEVHRCEAMVRDFAGNISSARNSYEAAIELEPKSAPLRYWFGGFLLRKYQEVESALNQFEEAMKIDTKSIEIRIEYARACMFVGRFDETKNILERLVHEREISSHIRRKIYDLDVQYYYRKAELYISQKEYVLALDFLEKMKDSYYSFPENASDKILRIRILKAEKTIKNLKSLIDKYLNSQEKYERILNLYNWISDFVMEHNEISNSYLPPKIENPVIIRILYRKNYGFIRDTDKKTLFFHKGSLVNPHEWESLKINDKVDYKLGQNDKGLVALEVKKIS